MNIDTITNADALTFTRSLPDNSVNCVVTSPPYWGVRDYGVNGQLGNEATYQEYIANMVTLFCEVLRVLRPDGVMWLNLGDTYTGSGRGGQSKEKRSKNWQPQYIRGQKSDLPSKSLIGIPHRVRFALQDIGWIARQDVIWHKLNVMPSSVTDRPTTDHEYVFLMTKSGRYWYDAESIKEPVVQTTMSPETRNKRSVWSIPTQPFSGAHFAVFPESLIEPMILAGCPEDGIVFDPFMGSGTTALVARRLKRHFIGCELNPEYVQMAESRLAIPYQTTMI